ncbi:hypothetical protein ACQKNX_07180 [Lysinibacillus sp. NPDC093712]|uniref:hypothetical protein n=1 Tax=Lysinibacillus sp. NPDC093712 TaxID=3390579 RepID=UPI003D080E59
MLKKNCVKSFVAFICFVLAFTMISPNLAKANEYQDLQLNNSFQETTIGNELENDSIIRLDTNQDLDVPFNELNNPDVLIDAELQPFIAPVIPLLAAVTIRYGVPFLAKTASKRIVYVSKHAAEQAYDRGITGKMMDDALSNGTKYVDGWSGERIAWLENESENNRTAVLLKKVTDEIDTVYNQKSKKLKWLKSTWQYVGDK